MRSHLAMPTKDELAEISHSELYNCIYAAFFQWQEGIRVGGATTESRQIFDAYDRERLKRLNRLNKYVL